MSFISNYLKGYGKVSPKSKGSNSFSLDSLPRFASSSSIPATVPAAGKSSTEPEDMAATSYWFNQAAESDPYLPALSKKQRILGFFTLLCLGLFCFAMAGFIAPFILLRSRKFALLYSLGSVFTVGSFSLLWGPLNHLKHLFSIARLPFTLAYFSMLIGTLYSALVLKSTIVTLGFATFQMVALVWYVFSYVPGGTTGLKFFTKLCGSAFTRTVETALPV